VQNAPPPDSALLIAKRMEKTTFMSRHIKDPHPDGACHVVRTPSDEDFSPAEEHVTAGDH